ncbi:MAG: EAL domain-containing protein [Methylotenera sp.]|uniref:two-component system response regulator n=1 Tax=Methylotenera sp. TaxID=2051956 RepID=UPI00248752FB|nr:EAL domain-containing protein [Methylotenera sp.]MDI1310255.1 EAL domain-containing protein [Methylotenera sp.]
MKILIAEDDENSRHLLEVVLSSNGYEVISFDNGFKALVYLKTNAVDLIVSDILMPEMDGYGLCREVKQNPYLQNIPFIFYTATYTSAQDERFAMSLGATKFLVKPMMMEDFLPVIAKIINANYQGSPQESNGKTHFGPLRLDKQHADIMRMKLDKKLIELNEEKQKLIASEARFRDFAEASADWFWESDANLRIQALAGSPAGLEFYSLEDLAKTCHSHIPSEMLETLQSHKHFSDYVVHFIDASGKLVYLRVSGKPIFDEDIGFIGYRGVGRDVSEMIALNRRVEFLASHDELTGLPNRGLFKQRLNHAIAKANRINSQVLLLYFDLDHFKLVNDTLGHEAGDLLLIMATKRISECIRSYDTLCRLGGDEFVMIMEEASPQDGHRLVRDIIAKFTTPFDLYQQRVYTTISVGVSVYPDDTVDPQSLLVFADLAMYRAKQNGRNCFEFYTTDLNFIAHQWLDMENGIRHALKENQLFLEYQPQVENTNQNVVGIEALLRWQHPERGLISPLEFIKIAEQSSLINQIGDWVLEAVCQQIRIWLDQGYQVPRVSTNISARHLRSENLIQALKTLPVKYQIPTNMLCIEITEHALLDDIDIVKKNMSFIKEAGFNISLDDFGMGHSSLIYLKRWAVDEVKIDRAFISGLQNCEEDRVIVKAIVALADALGLDIVSEGIENQSQADIVKASGCKVVQGYFYSIPLPAAEIATWSTK